MQERKIHNRRTVKMAKNGVNVDKLKPDRKLQTRLSNIYRHLRPASFTIAEFREWVKKSLDRGCRYCSTKLTAQNVSVDHVFPLGRGGSSGLENLVLACLLCNRMKGVLSEHEFSKLVMVVREWPVDIQMEFWARLVRGGRRYRGL